MTCARTYVQLGNVCIVLSDYTCIICIYSKFLIYCKCTYTYITNVWHCQPYWVTCFKYCQLRAHLCQTRTYMYVSKSALLFNVTSYLCLTYTHTKVFAEIYISDKLNKISNTISRRKMQLSC